MQKGILGTGNSSQVVRATHRLDGCDYAIKIWPIDPDSAQELKLISWLQINCPKESLAHIVRYHSSW